MQRPDRMKPLPRARAASSRVLVAILAPMLASSVAQVQAAPTEPPLPSPKPAGHERVHAKLMQVELPAKALFAKASVAAPLAPAVHGYYNRGCLAGAQQLPKDGSAWQAMRLSRNRHWGHPRMIELVKKLAVESQTIDGWPGLLVGDIAMPRGGPMNPAHASHQIGLDADIWLTPMPDRRLTDKERESMSAVFMLTKDQLAINPEVWTEGQEKLIKRAASYASVERVLVHPAIKKRLCETAGTDRGWLAKVRPVWGHNYHFHIRMSCPPGSTDCRKQDPIPDVDGCGAELMTWYKRLEDRLKPRPKVTVKQPRRPARKPREITLADMPTACREVIEAK